MQSDPVCTWQMPNVTAPLSCRSNRRRLGLLEKKKDYRKRADDYHRKEKAIQVLTC